MSVDSLYNVAVTALFGVVALWWTIFNSLLLHQRTANNLSMRQALETLALPVSKMTSASELVDRWFLSLAAAGVTFTVNPNYEIRLVGLKWFLAGLIIAEPILLVVCLMVVPTAEGMDTVRLLSQASLITSGLILIAIIVTGWLCGAQRAVIYLANPKG